MVKSKIESTNVGKSLLRRAGNSLKFLFEEVAASSTLKPGDILQVDAPAALGCSKLFFIECLPWDGVGGQSVQVRSKVGWYSVGKWLEISNKMILGLKISVSLPCRFYFSTWKHSSDTKSFSLDTMKLF